jgi:hypothetical protein
MQLEYLMLGCTQTRYQQYLCKQEVSLYQISQKVLETPFNLRVRAPGLPDCRVSLLSVFLKLTLLLNVFFFPAPTHNSLPFSEIAVKHLSTWLSDWVPRVQEAIKPPWTETYSAVSSGSLLPRVNAVPLWSL